MKNSDWDNLLNTLITYGQELLNYEEAHYQYKDEALILSWKTGEDSGGNCWGGTAHYSPNHQKQPEFIILDELLLQIDPDFKLKDFRLITQKITKNETSHREYYGNGTYYNQLVLEKDDLIQALTDGGYNISTTQLKSLNQYFEEKAYSHIQKHHIKSTNKNVW